MLIQSDPEQFGVGVPEFLESRAWEILARKMNGPIGKSVVLKIVVIEEFVDSIPSGYDKIGMK